MKLSARNQFKGKVVDIQEGAVNGIVKIDIGGGNVMSATISMNAITQQQRGCRPAAPCLFLFYCSVPSSTSTSIVPPQTMPSDSATSPVRSMSTSL